MINTKFLVHWLRSLICMSQYLQNLQAFSFLNKIKVVIGDMEIWPNTQVGSKGTQSWSNLTMKWLVWSVILFSASQHLISSCRSEPWALLWTISAPVEGFYVDTKCERWTFFVLPIPPALSLIVTLLPSVQTKYTKKTAKFCSIDM